MTTADAPPLDDPATASAADPYPLLKMIELFRTLPEDVLRGLLEHGRPATFGPGDVFIVEDDEAHVFYAILDGAVEVRKRGTDGLDHPILTLNGPTAVGEFALFDPQPRSSTIAAVTATRALAFSIDDIRASGELYQRMLESNAQHSIRLLRKNNSGMVDALQQRLDEARKRAALGVLFVYMVTGLALYTISLHFLQAVQDWVPGGVRTVSISILIFFGGIALLAIRQTRFPLAFYGLTFKGWRRSLWEGVVFSIPLVLALTLYKWVMISFNPAFAHVPLIDPWGPFLRADGTVNWAFYFIAMAAYAATVPLQELICRGGMQSALQNLLDGPRWRVVSIAVLTSNLLFATAHSHQTLAFVATVFFPGLFWGWLYSRHTTMIGVCASHIIGGVWVLYGMGPGGLI